MKKYILSVCTMFALAGVTLTSCSDAESMRELKLARVLSPTNLTAVSSTLEPSITLSWDASSNAESYVVEVYEEDPDFATTPVRTIDTQETSCVIADLLGETEYNFRVKGLASGVEESKWSTITRKTAAEQILAVSFNDIEENEITVTWPTNKTIDRLTVSNGESVLNTYTIDETAAALGVFNVSGLTGGTEYTIEVFLGEKRRGFITVKTEISKPVSDYSITAENISTDNNIAKMLNDVADQAAAAGKSSYSVTVQIPAGQTVEFYSIKAEDGSKDNVTLPDGMSVYFYGDKDNMPTIDFGGVRLDIAGKHETIAFQKVRLVGTGYLINQSNACDVTNLSFEICEMSGFMGNTLLRTQGSNSPKIDNIEVKSCVIHDCSNNYSVFDLRKSVVKTVLIQNTTIYNSATGGKCIVQRDANINQLTFSGVTLYNVCGNAQYFIDFGSTDNGPDKFVFENVLMAKTADDNTAKVIRASSAPMVNNSYYTNDWYKAIDGATMIDVEAAEVFEDPDNADFTVKEAYIGLGAGDPHWLP